MSNSCRRFLSCSKRAGALARGAGEGAREDSGEGSGESRRAGKGEIDLATSVIMYRVCSREYESNLYIELVVVFCETFISFQPADRPLYGGRGDRELLAEFR